MSWRSWLLALLLAALGAACAGAAPAGAPAPARAVPAETPGAAAGSTATPGAARGSAAAPALDPLRLTYVAQSAIFGPVWAAQEAGYFTRYGLAVELSHIPGATRLQQAVLGGQTDYGVLAGTSALAATLAGAPSPLLAEWIDLPVWYLIVRPEIAQPTDLRGKRVAITQFGSGTDYVLRKVLRGWGLEPERDVALLQMGGTQEIFAGLAGGAVDAGPMAAPLHLRAEREGYRPLLDLADTGVRYPQMNLTATREHLQGRDAQVLNLIRALSEATWRFKSDQALALALLAQYSGDTEPEALRAAWQSAAKLLKDVPAVSEEGVRGVLDDWASTRPDVAGARFEELAAPHYVRQLEAEGFYRQPMAQP